MRRTLGYSIATVGRTDSGALDGFTWARTLRCAAVLGAATQLVILLVQSTYIYGHSQLSQDFYIFEQARYLIAHGAIDPFSTARGFAYWQNHGEFIIWPLAWISRFTLDSGFFLLIVQAASTAGATYVGTSWLIERWERDGRRWGPAPALAVVAGLVVLLINPWTYLADSFDFHLQALDGLLVMLTARALDQGRHRVVALCVLLMLGTGDVAGTYVSALGVSALVVAAVRRQPIRTGICLIGVGVAWTLVLSALKANQGYSVALFYGYLTTVSGNTALSEPSLLDVAKGAILHSGRMFSALGRSSTNIWANLAAPGLIGLGSLWALPLVTVTVASYGLIDRGLGTPWSRPSFQSVPTYGLITVGSVMVVMAALSHSRARWRIFGIAGGLLVFAQSLAWAAVMLPKVPKEWTNVTPAGRTALARARTMIPAGAEVIAEQGVVGAFSDHRYVYFSSGVATNSESFPVHASDVYFVSAFYQAAETPVVDNLPLISEAAALPGARVIFASPLTGVWIVRWRPPSGVRKVTIKPASVFPAWLLPSAVGHLIKPAATSQGWFVRGQGAGYATYGEEFALVRGSYLATVRASTTGPLSIQVWDDSTDKELTEATLRSRRIRELKVRFAVTTVVKSSAYIGSTLLRYQPIPPPPGDVIELRVYQAARVTADIYSAGISRAPK